MLLAAAVALGVCAGGVQLLPTLDVLRHSVRSAPTLEFRLSARSPRSTSFSLWSPYAFTSGHDAGVYDGAFCTVALVGWRCDGPH
jgi:hypothetical protein